MVYDYSVKGIIKTLFRITSAISEPPTVLYATWVNTFHPGHCPWTT